MDGSDVVGAIYITIAILFFVPATKHLLRDLDFRPDEKAERNSDGWRAFCVWGGICMSVFWPLVALTWLAGRIGRFLDQRDN